MKRLGQCKSFWRHKNEWAIIPEFKIVLEFTRWNVYLNFEVTWLCYSTYYAVVFNKS